MATILWIIGHVLLFHAYTVDLQCLVCVHAKCQPTDVGATLPAGNVSVMCTWDHEDDNMNATDWFTNRNDLYRIAKLSLKGITPPLVGINWTQLNSLKEVDLSNNRLFYFNASVFIVAEYLNMSNCSLRGFNANLNKLTNLDLSYNSFSQLSDCKINRTQLLRLNLRGNSITQFNNVTFKSLTHLNIARNRIKYLLLGICPKLTQLDVSENLIQKISSNISLLLPKLEAFNLSRNAIVQLNNSVFNMSNLIRLDLSHNHIRHLSSKCFYGLTRLQILDLSFNQITTVHPSTLQYSTSLVELIVSDNPQLFTQDFGILLASRRLKHLNASNSNQKQIPSSLTRSVRFLQLSLNDIRQIQCGDLDSYPLLHSLDLSGNNISFIEDDALGRLELLKKLNLNNNSLTYIPHTLPNNLKILELRRNVIHAVSNADFTGLTQLRSLDLSRNQIVTLGEGTFAQSYNLEVLNLSRNSIQVISTGSFTGARHLKVLDLSYLVNVTKCEQALCFPVPEKNEIQALHLTHSPELAGRLLNDTAALKTFKQLNTLDVSFSNLTDFRDEISNYFARLKHFNLMGNDLNCTAVGEIFLWSDVNDVADCVFEMSEKQGTTVSPPEENPIETWTATSSAAIMNDTHAQWQDALKNATVQDVVDFNGVETGTAVSNEIWGSADAYSAEAPSSHPGLFIMLLLPVTLLIVFLAISYSRFKRKVHQHHERQRCEMDIEISNISSELW